MLSLAGFDKGQKCRSVASARRGVMFPESLESVHMFRAEGPPDVPIHLTSQILS